MVRRSRRAPAAAIAAALVAAPALSGCARALEAGLGLLGIDADRPAGMEGRGIDRVPPAPAARDRSSATIGDYESAPTYTWDRYGTASPVSFARFMSQGIDGQSCTPLSPGLSRVLPVGEGSPAVGVQHFGPITFGLAGPGTAGLSAIWLRNPTAFAQAAMSEAARMGTYQDCQRGIFAFVTLGDGYDPVVVR
jgi:hypothetical protein